jgi:hypothetical protein
MLIHFETMKNVLSFDSKVQMKKARRLLTKHTEGSQH